MNKFLGMIVITTLFISFGPVKADIPITEALVNVVDDNLRNCLSTASAELNFVEQVTSLNCENQNIYYLNGVEQFSFIKTLKLNGNQISDIDVLLHLPADNQIQIFDISGNNIADYSPLHNLSNLTELHIGNENMFDLSIIDVIKNLTQLKQLYLTDIQSTNYSRLTELTFLNSVSLINSSTNDVTLKANMALEISGTPAASVNEDSAYNFIPTLTYDGDLNTLIFTISNAPAWISIVSATGELTGTPTNDDVGITSNILISVTNGSLEASLPLFDIEVINTNDAPTYDGGLSNISIFATTSTYSSDISSSFNDVDAGDILTFSATGLPSHWGIEASTGRLIGIPGSSGTYSVTFTATDLSNSSVSANISINVKAPDIGDIDVGGFGPAGGSIDFRFLLLTIMLYGYRSRTY